MATKLKDLSVEKIALVPEGDNKGAEALIYKRRDQPPEDAVNPSQDNKNPEGTEDSHDSEKSISKATGGDMPHPEAETNGGIFDMKIDKSRLTPEELAQLDAIEKKAGIPEEPAPPADPAPESAAPVVPGPAAPTVTEPAAKSAPAATETPAVETSEDIYKGLHPAVAAELQGLRKWKDEAENRELLEVAKKYEIIGKKPEELAATLKSLKAAGGGAYDQMIAVLDASVQAVEQAGVFSEIGKSGQNSAATDGGAWAQIEKHAEAIQKAAPNLSWHQAVDKACEQHPDLVHEYEANR